MNQTERLRAIRRAILDGGKCDNALGIIFKVLRLAGCQKCDAELHDDDLVDSSYGDGLCAPCRQAHTRRYDNVVTLRP